MSYPLIPHPGLLLKEAFLIPLKITPYRLAKSLGVSQTRIGEILCGKRQITADTALRLSRFFGLDDFFWLQAQMQYELASTKRSIERELSDIIPYRPQNEGY